MVVGMQSQFGQDAWVIDRLSGMRNGFFIEMGAKDGVHFSNTYELETSLCWDGLCIEPHPVHFDALRKSRRCSYSNACADGEVRIVEFWQAPDGQGGIIMPKGIVERKVNEQGAREKDQIISIQTQLLYDVFREFQVPKKIDYFSLDVEGAEEAILAPFPFDEFRFRILTVERPPLNLKKLLYSYGYAEVDRLGEDTCFEHRDFDAGF